jgi:hypothetical protein
MMFYNGFNLFIDICIAVVVGYLFYKDGYRAGYDQGYEHAVEESYDD